MTDVSAPRGLISILLHHMYFYLYLNYIFIIYSVYKYLYIRMVMYISYSEQCIYSSFVYKLAQIHDIGSFCSFLCMRGMHEC
jgi:hypothetical protein